MSDILNAMKVKKKENITVKQPLSGLVEDKKSEDINIGDYIVYGKYYDQSILWRVIDKDKDGDPLLLSDKILCLKPFDASGVNHTNANDNRTKYGSNLWRDSNLRCWLNSSDMRIVWKQMPPSAANVYYGLNAYDKEKGFLAEGNFTGSEIAAIKTVVHKTLLHDVDKNLKEGGNTYHTYNDIISTVVQNYDSAYYHNVEDKVFILDVKEINEVFNKFGSYYIGQPTSSAVEKSEYKQDELSEENSWYYWLRSPSTEDSHGYHSTQVLVVSSAGHVLDNRAHNRTFGVRPALFLNLSSVIFKSGADGSVDKPYEFVAVK